jgi:hypothetical protein
MAKHYLQQTADQLDALLASIDKKAGNFYYDASNNRYLVFTDEAARDTYLDNPTDNAGLIIGTFDAPFNYSAEITLITPTYNAVFLNSTGNYLDFSFDIKNKQGASTGENVTVTYTFIRNADKKIVTESRRYGEQVHYNIDEYLLEGTNTIIIGVMGQSTLAATTVALTYQVVNLTYNDEMNISKVYDLSKGSAVMEVFFSVSGYGTKIVEWFVDGEQLEYVKHEDEVVDASSQRTKYITLAYLSSGVHTLQSRAYSLINGEKFYTDTLYREFIVNNGGLKENVIAMAANLPSHHGIVKEDNPFILYGLEQYVPFDIRFATRISGEVTIYLGEDKVGSVNSIAGRENIYTINSNKYGSLPIRFVLGENIREIPATVNKTSLNIEEITNALSFDFRATGKSNASVDKDQWSYGDYTGTFEGFNWNASSGWVNNALLISSGASFSVDIAPLATDATSVGKTLEFEFSTRNVENDDAVVCDLTDTVTLADGSTRKVGILITASEAKMVSYAGVEVSTKFKAGEVNRIAFVVNRKQGVTYKGLVFIYVNGILSGAINYGAADNFVSTKEIVFRGSADAQVELRAMRFYESALSGDNILNNYILYRDTLLEMMEVYYRNDIYAEGTQSFSPDLMLHRLPVMIIIGDIPTLEGATSTSTQVIVDIEYTNEQDPTKNFKMKNAALRIQGTSSLAYPRKNFRFYTQKEASTVVYDAEGKILKDKLYSFKDGAQPVDCWCLKADYAESSGTHNTGVAKIWNDVLFNAQFEHKNILGETNNGYLLRTQAQVKALENSYEYDVRTTIDGFPIVLFYKRNAGDTNLTFLGKYNFNNDKSTPSVFGFENIPGFNNERMQCWETKDNGHPLGLFTDVSNFDSEWSEAFESRYPDTSTPNTSDLKSFSQWLNGVSQEDFVTEKWSHLDVYKVAAYYCYLMRFGAVDQPVKNGFLTSEDGVHFFYINYDNDTINGLINTGDLRLDPTVNRQTVGSDGEYVYAGHDSVMWNRCEADAEFMEIVSIVDNALYSAGLKYESVISVFNDEQSDKWVERVYNQDAEYKYLLPYVNTATNNLFMLQGSRASHRKWWLSKRFSLYDSLFLSGNYKDRNISFKCLNNTAPGKQFSIIAGTNMLYGYGVNNGTREVGVDLNINDTHTFTTTDTLNVGDVVKVFGAANILEFDLSKMMDRIAVLDCTASYDPALGTKLKRLILGNSTSVNNELASISGIGVLTSLQELNLEGYTNIKSLDLSTQSDLRKVYAKRSGVGSIVFKEGAPVEYLELPTAMMELNFSQLPYLTSENIILEGGYGNIQSIKVLNCPNLTNDHSFVMNWLSTKTSNYDIYTLNMDGIDWNMTAEEFLLFSDYKRKGVPMTLYGKVYLQSMSLTQAEEIQSIWGNDCFDKNADFRITAPDALYISPADVTINEGESVQFSYILFSDSEGTVTYKIVGGYREGVVLDEQTGLLTSIENGSANSTIYVRAIYTSITGNVVNSTAMVIIKKRVYPTNSQITITGPSTVKDEVTYSWSVSNSEINGDMVSEWSLSGNAFTNGYVLLSETSYQSCIVSMAKFAEKSQTVSGTITVTLKKKIDNTVVATKSKTFTMAQYNYPTATDTTITGDAEPKPEGTTYSWSSTATGNIGPISAVWHLDESLQPFFEISNEVWDENNPLQGSCVVKKVYDSEFYVKANLNLTITYTNSGTTFTVSKQIVAMSDNLLMTEETNPEVLKVLYSNGLCANSSFMTKAEAAAVQDASFVNGSGNGIFYQNTKITSFEEFKYFTGLTILPYRCFASCTNLTKVKLPETIINIKAYAFQGGKFDTIELPENLTTLESYAFYGCSCESLLSIPSKVTKIPSACFMYSYFKSIQLHENIESIEGNSFRECYNLESIEIPSKITSISSAAFKDCSRLKNVIFKGQNITHFQERCFEGCAIESLIFPESTTYIGHLAFEDCKELKSIFIGKNVSTISLGSTSIKYNPFMGCSKLEEIIVSSDNPRYYSENYNAIIIKDSKTIISGCINTFIPLDAKRIEDTAFYGTGISGVLEIPENIESIGYSAFCDCVNLTKIKFPTNASIGSDDDYICSGCTSLEEVILPENLTTLNNGFFNDCKNLKHINIPNTITTIRDYVFEGSGLETIVIPDSVDTIGKRVFAECASLFSVSFSSNMASLPEKTFYKAESLISIVIPNNVTSIGENCFANCTNLKSVVLHNTITRIASDAFYYCISLMQVNIPTSLQYIPSGTFHSCRSLTEILIPESIISISSSAFRDTSLSKITFLSPIAPEIASNAFDELQPKEEIRIVYIPINNSGYEESTWWDKLLSYNFEMRFTYEPSECTSLSITADNVSGRNTTTIIHWTAITNGVDIFTGEQKTGVEIIGTAISEPFPQNTSTEEEVLVEISYTYMGVTATTSIVQGVWEAKYYSVNLNDGAWELTTAVTNPDSALYDGVYQSVKSKGVNSGYDIMYIDINGYENFSLYIRSYAESTYDYIMVSELDQTITSSIAPSSAAVKAHTQGIQNSGTDLSNYTLVEYTGIDGGAHRITVIYRKDSSQNSGDDRGYVLIPKNQ